jgi:RNA polymerase sigma factor (sigma-70 family)
MKEAEDDLLGALLHAVHDGDRAAFDRALAPLVAWLREVAQRRIRESLRRVLEPDDLVQDVLLTLYRSLRGTDLSTPKGLRTWITQVLDRRMLDLQRRHFRARKGFSTARSLADDAGQTPSGALSCLGDLVQANGATPSQHARLHEDHRRLEAILATLKPDHRTVIELACLQALPTREVATRMGRSPEAIHKLLARALEACGDEHRNGLPGHREASP